MLVYIIMYVCLYVYVCTFEYIYVLELFVCPFEISHYTNNTNALVFFLYANINI